MLMKICVLVKPAVDAFSIKLNWQTKQFENRLDSFNSTDLHALQWACNYKEGHKATVTAVIVKDENQTIELTKLKRMEIDEFIIIEHPGIKNKKDKVAYVVADKIKIDAYDLILCGSKSDDSQLGVTALQLGERTNMPVITHIHNIEPQDNHTWLVQRKAGRGLIENYSINLPAIIGVVSLIARKRYYPFGKPNKQSYKEEISEIELPKQSELIKRSEPQPIIRYAEFPSSQLSAQERLVRVMGFQDDNSGSSLEKVTEPETGKHIYFTTQRLLGWLEGG